MFTHRSTVDLNPVVVQMEIAKEVVGGMLATAGKAAAITIQTVGARMGFLGQTRLTNFDAPEKSLRAVRSNPLAGLGGET